MSKTRSSQAGPNPPNSTLSSGEEEVVKQDGKMVAYKKVWEFFWNTLTFGEKCAIEVGLLVVAGFIASGGYWFGEKLSQSKLEQQKAESSREMTTLENKIADLERKLSERRGENEPTLETAKAANRTYLDFVNDLNVAR